MNRQNLAGWALVAAALALPVYLAVLLALRAAGSNIGVPFTFETYPGLMVAIAAGFFGATFSMLVQTQRRIAEGSLDDLRNASSWRTLMVRGSVGIGAAAILYFFFRSGLLGGNLWPKLEELGFDPLTKGGTQAVVPNQAWCLLVIWCFLAGFSETLVPNILSKTEQKASTT
jgi:hypothetical protein